MTTNGLTSDSTMEQNRKTTNTKTKLIPCGFQNKNSINISYYNIIRKTCF